MLIAPLPKDEKLRLEELLRYQILDTSEEKVFDDLTQLAAQICQTPIALVSLIDSNRQWFKSKIGLDVCETPRDISFCSHTILENRVFIVENALEDERFCDNPLVLLDPKIQFYAGSVLVSPNGFTLGTLCVIDHKPRTLRLEQVEALQSLSRQVISQLELRSKLTELDQKKQELQKLWHQAQSANKAKTEFLANMSHEIRTPLGAIIGFNDILIRKSKELHLPDYFQEFQKNIRSSSRMLLELINNILDISKIEAGKMEVSEEIIRISDLIGDIHDCYHLEAAKKNINFKYEIDSKFPSTISSDRTKILQILTNLIGNAIKFSPTGKEILLRVINNGSTISFLVVDQGIGIPEDRIASIFDAFEQADQSTARHYGGTGLGLAITKKLTELLGGTISVESELGKGSTFCAIIPYRIAQPSVTITHKSDLQNENQFAKNNRLMVFEDNAMNQVLIEALLSDFNLQIYFADNGENGINKIKQLEAEGILPDLIIMDMHMPIMDGIKATQLIRSTPAIQNIPIVALSADAFVEQQNIAYEIGVNDYLTKPINLEQLIPILRKYLRDFIV